MSRAILKATTRDASGKSPVARRLRQTGRVPGVMYRKTTSGTPFSVDELEVSALFRHGATLIDLEIDGAKHTTIIKEYQVHPVRGQLTHVDFLEVALDESVRTTVDLVLVGESEGVKRGGVLSQLVHELVVDAIPMEIPDQIEVDITNLGIGDHMSVADISIPSGVTLDADPEQLIASVSASRASRSAGATGDDGEEISDEAAGDGDAAPAE